MARTIVCAGCGARYKVGETLGGRKAKCKKCGGILEIPLAGPTIASPSRGLGSFLDEELAQHNAGSPNLQSTITPSNSGLADRGLETERDVEDLIPPGRFSPRPERPRKRARSGRKTRRVYGVLVIACLAMVIVPLGWIITKIAPHLGSGLGGLRPIEYHGRTTEDWFLAVRKAMLAGKFQAYTFLRIEMEHAGASQLRNLVGADPASLPVLFDAVAERLGSRGDAAGGTGPEAAHVDRVLAEEADAVLGKFGAEEAKKGFSCIKSGLKDPHPAVRIWSLRLLGRVGREGAAELLPAVQEMVQSQDEAGRLGLVAVAAIAAVGQMGPAAVPVLQTALQDPREKVRCEAARALGACGADAQAAVPDLVAAMRQGDPQLRREVLKALGGIGSGAVEAIPLLQETVAAQKDEKNRRSAADALVKMGPPALAAAQKLLQAENVEVRRTMVDALGRLETGAKAFLAPLTTAVRDADAAVRSGALAALAKIGPGAQPAIPALLDLLRAQRSARRSRRPEAIANQPRISAALDYVEGRTGEIAAVSDVLVKLVPGASLPAADLADLVRLGGPALGAVAAEALEGMGAQAQPAIPALEEAVARSDLMIKGLEAGKAGEQAYTVLVFESKSGFPTRVKWRPLTAADIATDRRPSLSLSEIKRKYEILGYRFKGTEKPDTKANDAMIQEWQTLKQAASKALSRLRTRG